MRVLPDLVLCAEMASSENAEASCQLSEPCLQPLQDLGDLDMPTDDLDVKAILGLRSLSGKASRRASLLPMDNSQPLTAGRKYDHLGS